MSAVAGSLVDPHNYCPDHGTEELTTYRSTSRGQPQIRTYCRACRRARARKLGIVTYSRIDTNTCSKGHLKTKRTWRCYGGVWRCMVCQYLSASTPEAREKINARIRKRRAKERARIARNARRRERYAERRRSATA